MNFVVDENIGQTIVDYLRSNGHHVEWIKEVARGTSDKAILDLAYWRGDVIVTYDQDFGELVFSHHERHAGVILLRLPNQTSSYHIIALQKFLQSHTEAEIIGKFWKVDDRYLIN
jgi:predicted nuclease of predicted toxin-antitoxin system